MFLAGIQFVNAIRIRNYLSGTLFAPLPRASHLDSFAIADPYQGPGEYHKAQLHLHTSNSKDVAGKLPVRDTVLKYKAAGYKFVVITDHDLVTTCPELNSSGFVCLPGIELTIPFLFWPLGRHLVVFNANPVETKTAPGELFKRKTFAGNLIAAAHPNWRGNLGTGFWFMTDILGAGCQFIEIHNHHSDSSLDVRLWHKITAVNGYRHPVWGIAVDDTDNAEPLDQGWIMVKTVEITADAFLSALKNGGFYATTGPVAGFQIKDGTIEAQTGAPSQIDFIDGQNRLIASFTGKSGIYRPQGHEGFVRVEIRDSDGRTAWSQPFFLVPGSGV